VAKSSNAQKQLTPLELKIMQVVWTADRWNVQAVQQKLDDNLAYTTVQTMLNVLERKGHVTRTLLGRAFEYRAIQSREVAMGGAVHDLLTRMFDGSVENLVMNMLHTKQIDASKLAELAKKVALAEGADDDQSR